MNDAFEDEKNALEAEQEKLVGEVNKAKEDAAKRQHEDNLSNGCETASKDP